MGFTYENIAEWIKKEAKEVSYNTEEQLDWLCMVSDAVNELIEDYDKSEDN